MNKVMVTDYIYDEWNKLSARARRYILFLAAAIFALLCYIAISRTISNIIEEHDILKVYIEPFKPDYEKCPKIITQKLDKKSSDGPIKVAICIIATGAYSEYIPDVVRSGRKHLLATPLLKQAYNVTYIAFTSEPALIYRELNDTSDIRTFFKPYHGWPWDALYKYTTYLNYSSILQEFDFIFAMDADMRFVNEVGGEILGDLVGGAHAQFYEMSNTTLFPYERRAQLCAGIPYGIGKHYFQSTIFGGRTKNFLQMMCYLHQCIKSDFDPENGRKWLARVEDEAYLNRYFIDHPPTIILNPAYLWPVVYGEAPFTTRIEIIKKDNIVLHEHKKVPQDLDALNSLVGLSY